MFDTTSISMLLKILVVSVAGGIVACRAYWVDDPRLAVFALSFSSFMAGACCTAVYILVRYRHQLTPAGPASEEVQK